MISLNLLLIFRISINFEVLGPYGGGPIFTVGCAVLAAIISIVVVIWNIVKGVRALKRLGGICCEGKKKTNFKIG